ncbi:ankyrin repeat domain-containing protein [Micromonospora sp. HM5-17]|uniref:ankyrin repeat domain-containing protein n=1 Tax=Micromonospora sp. HM5-17 TaxID=2487710 RepID=UPI000F47A41A|nr:ankyrin repeat domain-containing protein [Micromonospora sp. HM5-17]ROT29378.1 ankyrin repeat domain-containing protein [Micromonospora sp. HM5-17]
MTTTPPVIPELRVWQRVRRYAVPPAMIEACTAAREAGDWRAACAAGRIDVTVDLAEVRREHGRRHAELIEADLAALAPDLLRWHLPRVLGGRTSVATHRQFLLSVREGRLDPGDPVLVLSTPKTVDGSQRLRLAVRPAVEEEARRWDLPPVYWSVRHVDGLAAAHGGSPARLPGFAPDGTVRFFEAYATTVDPADPASRSEVFDRCIAAGDLVAAWAATGVELDPTPPVSSRDDDAIEQVRAGVVTPVGLTAELTRLHRRYGVDRVAVGGRWWPTLEVRRRSDGTVTASFVKKPAGSHRHFLAEPVHTRPVDLELLRHGLIDPAALHPLVRRALLPHLTVDTAVRPDRIDLRRSVPVRCRGEWHTVVHADGRLDLASHTVEEVGREAALRALGGPISGCFAVLDAWRSTGGWLPRQLRELRREVLQRLQHGGSAAFSALLDAGLDPLMRDGRGRTLLHHLRCVRDVTLVRRLVDAGVPLNAADRRGRTALHVTVGDGGTPEMVRALLEAGADPDLVDAEDMSAAELAERKTYLYDDDEDEVPEEFRDVLRVRDVIEDWQTR